MPRHLAILTALLAAATAGAEGRPPKPKAAVLGVHAETGVAQGTANTIENLLTSDLVRADRYEILTSGDLVTLLGFERQKQLLGCAGDNCLTEIGAAAGAEWLIDGSVGAIGRLRVLTIRIYDVKHLQARRDSVTVDDETRLAEGVHELVARLLGLEAPQKKSAPRAGWFVLGGAGALALGGAGAGGLALSRYDAYRANPADASLHEAAKTAGYVADGLYAGAILTAAVAVALLLFAPSEATP